MSIRKPLQTLFSHMFYFHFLTPLEKTSAAAVKQAGDMVRTLTVFAGLQWLVMARAFLQAPGSVPRSVIAHGAFSSNLPSSINSSPASRQCAKQRRGPMLRPLLAEAEASLGEDAPQQPPQSTAIVAVEDQDNEGGPLKRAFRRVARFFGAGKEKPNLKQLGLYAVLSYGFVSNASYSICVGLAWFASSKKTGLSPLAPDQWQFFLVSYAALFAINNVLRVPRFALSVSLAPAFDRFISFLMRRTGRGKAFATGLCVFLVNFCGTISLMATGIVLASIFSGVPFWPV